MSTDDDNARAGPPEASGRHARRRVERALLDTKRELRSVSEHLRIALAAGRFGDFSWNASTRLLTLSDKAATVLGVTSVAPIPWSEVETNIHADDRVRVSEAMLEAVSHRNDFHVEFRLIEPERWICAFGKATGEPGTASFGITGVVEDVTGRVRAAQALEEERRALELLDRTGRAFAAELDLETLVQRVTDAATEISGAKFGAFFYNVSAEQGEYRLYTLSGGSRDAFEGLGLPRRTPLFDLTFRARGVVRCDDVTEHPRFGREGPHYGMPAGHLPVRSYLAVPVVTQSGEAIGALFFGHPARGVFSARAERLVMGMAAQAAVAIDNARLYDAVRRDAAERQSLLDRERRAREDAERATRLKDDFLATLSHELRTPLSAILGWSQLLRARPPSQNDLARGLEAVERNARTQLQLVEDLLDMSRIAAGKLRLELRLVDPAVVVEHAVESVALAAETKQIRIEKHFDADAGTVSGDPERLQQIVWNLLSNAVKFTPNGGHVHVSVRRAGEHAEIAVADSGIGIEPGYLGQVFERFRQVDGSAARRYGGLGLGLAIVRQLVDLHGGSVHVASGGANRGATFTVRLPVAAVHGEEEHGARAEPDVAETPAVAGADLRGARVLLVDDDPDGRELCGIVLEKHGAEVHTAAGAQQALAALEANAFHVLVSDIGMPGIDGYELLRRVRAMKGPAARVPAIALTAFAGPEDRARALRAGFRQHLTKPVAAEELARAVAKIVSAKPN